MRTVIVESPFKASVELEPALRYTQTNENIVYARKCLRDCLLRGEAPFASHLLYTQDNVLNDDDDAERKHGITAGFTWKMKADATVVYVDRGISIGMQYGIVAARGHVLEFRSLDGFTVTITGWHNRQVAMYQRGTQTFYPPRYRTEL